jgi:hypothetical protein
MISFGLQLGKHVFGRNVYVDSVTRSLVVMASHFLLLGIHSQYSFLADTLLIIWIVYSS